jgi:hypothetical protein
MLTKDDKIAILRTLGEGDKIICIQQFINSTGVKVKLGVYVVLAVTRFITGLRIQELIDAVEYGAITDINGFEFIAFFTTAKDYELNIDYYRSQLTTTTEEQNIEQEEENTEGNRDSKRELAEDAIEEFATVLKSLLLYISMWKKKGIDLEFSSHNPDNFSVSYRDYEGFRKSITRFIKLDMDNNLDSLDAKVERLLGFEYPMTKTEDGVDLYN